MFIVLMTCSIRPIKPVCCTHVSRLRPAAALPAAPAAAATPAAASAAAAAASAAAAAVVATTELFQHIMRAARTLRARTRVVSRHAQSCWVQGAVGPMHQRQLCAMPERGDAGTSTHFGFAEVPVEEKTAKVKDVFYEVAERYDIMNDLMSAGLHRCGSTLPQHFHSALVSTRGL